MKAQFRTVNNTATHPMWLASSVRVLEEVERLPHGATGALTFGEEGVILVENKRICWALAHGMRQRLTDLLCEHGESARRDELEALYRRCKRDGTSLGEALLASELVSLPELQRTLLRHNSEAVRTLAHSDGAAQARFSPLAARGYDPRLAFSPAELFAALSTRRYEAQAARARTRLIELTRPNAQLFAFLRDPKISLTVPVAVERSCSLRIAELLAVASWSVRTLDVASFVDSSAQVICGQWCASCSIVAFREDDIHYAALCESRPASTLLLGQLEKSVLASVERPVSTTLPKGTP